MVDGLHPQLSIVRQCALLQISRSGRYYQPVGEREPTLALMRLIDEAFLDCPYYGSRQMMRHLHRLGHRVGRNRVARLMRKMGLRAIYQKPNTSAPHPEHRVYPYLLRDLAIVRPNQVWCSDITYIPMRRGFLYLVAIMDWHSRRVLLSMADEFSPEVANKNFPTSLRLSRDRILGAARYRQCRIGRGRRRPGAPRPWQCRATRPARRLPRRCIRPARRAAGPRRRSNAGVGCGGRRW